MKSFFSRERVGLFMCLTLILPLIAFGQSDPNEVINNNTHFLESLGLLGGMAIAPFAALFVTSLISVLGLGNQFIAENPVLGNWITVVISGILTFAPLLPKFLKSTAVIGQAIDWLNDRAGAVVGLIVLISPYFNQLTESTPIEQVSLGFFDVGASPMLLLTLAIAIPYFIVVMTVRSFFGILIFLSPIPTLDAIFEVSKQGISVALVILYLVWPEAAIAFTGLVFIISFMLYRKAKRLLAFFKYLYLTPLLRTLGIGATQLVPSHLPKAVANELQSPELAIEVAIKYPYQNWRKRQIVWLTVAQNEVKLIQPKWFGMTEMISLGAAESAFSTIEKKWSHFSLVSKSNDLHLQLNLSFGSHIDFIEAILHVENESINNANIPHLSSLAKTFGQSN